MPTDLLTGAARRLCRAATLGPGTGPTDGQLLERYLTSRDETAFEALVRRHGPLVLGVCRRLLGHEQDAEDAFQATFLVLARKGARVQPPDRVGGWLYGVARRTALKARALGARRRLRERHAAVAAVAPESPVDGRGSLLEQEVGRLPEVYRTAVVLCHLQGKTRKEAAHQLGWPEGTVATRLRKARSLLARRLTRHGVAVAAAFAALPAAPAAVPPSLLASTLSAAAGVASTAVARLTEGVLSAMLLARIKSTAAVLLLACIVSLGGWVGYQALAGPPTPRARPASAPAPVESLDGVWGGVSVEVSGRKLPAELAARVRLVVSGSDYTLQDGTAREEGVLTLGPAGKARSVDFAPLRPSLEGGEAVVQPPPPAMPGPGGIQPPGPRLGIVERDGDTLRLCLASVHVKRPDTFAPAPGRFLVVLKRLPRDDRPPARVGRITILGNARVPYDLILRKIGLWPGDPLEFPRLRTAEEKLVGLGLFEVDPKRGLRPTISLATLQGQNTHDVLIQVTEKRPDRTDAQKLQGTWELTGKEEGGRLQTRDEMARQKGVVRPERLRFSRWKFTIERKSDEKTETLSGTFDLDSSRRPQRLTLTEKDQTDHNEESIYFVHGDELMICFRGDGRPSTFDTVNDPTVALFMFRRVKK